MEASISFTRGFTLVEISIVMIIVGLLIGGTFGGMKLIENMQVNKTVQDLKAIDSAALTFRDTYGRLPGDIRNPSTRLPSCTVAPCATTGDGNRQIDPTGVSDAAIDPTMEKFTFWHHLQAADLLSMNYKNVADTAFGEGQPDAPIGGGYRVSSYTGQLGFCPNQWRDGFLNVTNFDSAAMGALGQIDCSKIESIDRKIDDGRPSGGNVVGGWGCESIADCSATYLPNNTGRLFYNSKF